MQMESKALLKELCLKAFEELSVGMVTDVGQGDFFLLRRLFCIEVLYSPGVIEFTRGE